jgi:hypothetical protein
VFLGLLDINSRFPFPGEFSGAGQNGSYLLRRRSCYPEQKPTVRAFERELEAEPDAPSHSRRVTLPLVPSKEPGTMDLKDFNFDDLLA